MSTHGRPTRMVGNDIVAPRRVVPVRVVENDAPIPVTFSVTPAGFPVAAPTPMQTLALPQLPALPHFGDILHRYSLAIFALLFLMIASTGVEVGAHYYVSSAFPAPTDLVLTKSVAGLNTSVPATGLQAELDRITNQPAHIQLGEQSVAISPSTIRSWLDVTPSADGTEDSIHVKGATVAASIKELVNSKLKTPVNQVSVTHDDGTSGIVVRGVDGTALTNPAGLTSDSQQISKSLLAAGGIELNAPTDKLPFQAVTPAAFPKLLEVNVVTKKMYAYENGTLTRTFLISAGAPETPTPLGEYHIYSKLTVQDMSGFNPNGTKYFQPHVRWINYFLPGGYAVHGNYWRPLSWFGARNSSHGCVSLPDNEAKWVYDWAPVGTTVITHA